MGEASAVRQALAPLRGVSLGHSAVQAALHTLAVQRRLQATSLWNAVIPGCAKNVEVGPTHIVYLHPTKGRRRVDRRRVGLDFER